MKKSLSRITAMLILPVLFLSACAGGRSASPTSTPTIGIPAGGVIGPASPSDTPAATPHNTVSPIGTPTEAVSTPLPVTGETSTPDNIQVTGADNGTSITLHVGQTFLLNLGDQYNWTVSVLDPSVVGRVVNITVIRGAQGVYRANKPGTTTLIASGDPACRQATPSCAMPSIIFEVALVVEQ